MRVAAALLLLSAGALMLGSRNGVAIMNSGNATPRQPGRKSPGGNTTRQTVSTRPDPRNGSLPRGIRNNNPGNIEKGAAWQGLAADQSADDRFAIFVSPVWGIRAMAVILKNYRRLHGIRTIEGVVSRWAPSFENNTRAYIASVAANSGLSPTEPIDLSQRSVLQRVIPALIVHENGQNPYSRSLINEGIRRAF